MELKEEGNLILRVTEYGITNKQFSLIQLKQDLNLNLIDYQYVRNSLTSIGHRNSENPNHILVLSESANKVNADGAYNYDFDLYSILPNAFYNYVDYLEIKEARKVADQSRKHAEQAQKSSDKAIKIALFAFAIGLLQVVVEIIGLLQIR